MSETADLLSAAALGAFRLNGQFMHVAEGLAKPAGITAAWWQVLGAVVRDPLPVAGIARVMGMTRQGVQRIADLLVERGLAEYRPNPAHRRAKLLQPTRLGREAMAEIVPGHQEFADRLVGELGLDGAKECVAALQRLSAALDRLDSATEP
ncbi:MarR family winged helix-turn-helix transcriptional regulator [Nonomuraea zeae]|uniref:MarR family transcriptional regulator n=1 Tax=Nonomuraea zeae TaxID=1642303 RepID=A0A5S4GX91_9ACTN|nr:MarR family transcriptional regulator [Nonomuraea zeae]TMR37615.1 MarR family transcriptional regulator [Nonomuraea zeae]